MSGERNQTALVTGASAGIGREIADLLGERGFELVLVARRAEQLAELARAIERRHGVRASAIPLDLLREDAGEVLERELAERGLQVDLLVNDAGVMEIGAFHELPRGRLLRLVQLNAVALTDLTHRFLGPMVARRSGRLLNVASLAAFQPVPSLALYAATKSFVLSLSESLSEELRDTGVSVTALCPGLTRTHMVEQAQEANPLARMMPGFLISDTRQVAREGVEACLAGRTVVVPGIANRLQASLVGFYPRTVIRTIGGWIGRRGL